MSPRIGKGVSVGEAAAQMLGGLDRGGARHDRAAAVTAWRTIAGPEVASHARGFALRDGELLVFVDTPVWANELSALSESYRQAINRSVGKELVGSMRFAVSRKVEQEAAWDRADEALAGGGRPERVTPVPASEQELAQIEAMAAEISDDGVREAVIRAAVRHLEWQKGIRALSGS